MTQKRVGAKAYLLRSELDMNQRVVWLLGIETGCASLKVEVLVGSDGPVGLVSGLTASGCDAHVWSQPLK